MTVKPVIYHATLVLSDNWYRANPRGWLLAVGAARARGVTLLDLIRDRYLLLRDEVAREAFDVQGDASVIAWERRSTRGGDRPSAKCATHGDREIIGEFPPCGETERKYGTL